jgi:hypothetical protein
MQCSLFKFTVALNSVHLFWKLLAFKFLLCISETFLSSMSSPPVKIVLLLDELQLLILSVANLKHLGPKLFLVIMFYNCTS